MYNKELKSQFASEYSKSEASRKSLFTLFEAIGRYEEEYGKDICQMGVEEIRTVLNSVLRSRATGKRNQGTPLRAYFQWCIDRNIDGASMNIDEIDLSSTGLDKFRAQTVASPQHLQRYLDTVFEKESEDTVDVVYRCFLWLAYMGVMNEEDALKISVSDVDFESMSIKYNGKEYPFYREAIPSLKKCATLTSFRFIHPNYSPVFKPRVGGTLLLRSGSETLALQALRSKICMKTRARKYLLESQKDDKSLDLRLSYDRVWLSGRFFSMLENERSGMKVDFTYLAEEFMEGKVYNLSSGRNLIGAKVRQIARDYSRDYEWWKQAYSSTP